MEKQREGEWNEFEKEKMDEYDHKLREKLQKEYEKKMVNQKNVNE